MIYIVYYLYFQFAAVPTEDPTQFTVQKYEASKETLFTRKDEALSAYYKLQALAGVNNYTKVVIDSFTICPVAKKVDKNKP